MPIQDAPDGTVWTEIISVVVDTPTPPSPAHEKAITRLHRLSTALLAYGQVVEWTVTAATIGVLRFVEMESDNYAKTRFKLTIAGKEQFADKQIEASLSLEWPDVRLAAGVQVLLEAASSDLTAINVDGDILGKEIG
ncbi:hypothetical protein ES708_01451 [subsurface metagenome]